MASVPAVNSMSAAKDDTQSLDALLSKLVAAAPRSDRRQGKRSGDGGDARVTAPRTGSARDDCEPDEHDPWKALSDQVYDI